ncbi:MAG: response regulator, partial [Myxococcales bacterium]|nr:response regulator [Myxococcales bacterium]
MSRDVPIGRLLVEAGVLDPAALDMVRAAQQQRGGRFCSAALALGLATERALVRVLSRQLGTPGVVVAELAPDPEALAAIPAELARRHGAAPARLYNRTLTVVMRDPGDRAALDDLQFHAGRTARPLVALAGPLAAALERWYGDQAPTEVLVAPADASIDLLPMTPPLEFDPAPVAPLPADQVLPLDLEPGGAPADAQLVASLAPAAVAPVEASLRIDAAAPDDDGRPVVLAVDDEPSILKLYAGMLDPARYRLVTCARGDEALQAVRRHRPHLVLLDALLPGVHGFEICRLVKSTDALADTQVVLLSAAYRGWQMKADLKARCGADDFFEKPFDVGALLQRVEELVGDAHASERRTRPLPTDAL